VNAFFHDWVMAVLAMPALVWALFLGLALGFGHVGPVVAVVLAGIPFVIINVREGVRNTPKELFDMARAFGVPQNKITRHVLLPSLMPFFFAAIRYAYAIGWKGLVITEVFASDRGMGWTIKFWYDAHRAHGVIGYALFFIIFAMALEKLVFDPLADKAFKWRPKLDIVQMAEADFGAVAAQGVLIAESQAELDDGIVS
jgi:ABC-type nitrate/sulfonate/bicarbonate transport system permease component